MLQARQGFQARIRGIGQIRVTEAELAKVHELRQLFCGFVVDRRSGEVQFLESRQPAKGNAPYIRVAQLEPAQSVKKTREPGVRDGCVAQVQLLEPRDPSDETEREIAYLGSFQIQASQL